MVLENSYTKSQAWQLSYSLTLDVYKSTKSFPATERFGLTSQMQRAASSVPFNIAEGYARLSKKEKIQFYSIARGSLAELQTQLLLSKDLGYISIDTFTNLLSPFQNSLRSANQMCGKLVDFYAATYLPVCFAAINRQFFSHICLSKAEGVLKWAH